MERVPLGDGVGLRSDHYPALRERAEEAWGVDWFEAITENYLDDRGNARATLEWIAQRRPVVLHGVSLSIGGTDALDIRYLRKLGALAREVHAAWISDHLCWTRVGRFQSHDLLPLPYTPETLAWCVERVRRVQDLLDRPIALENPSRYLDFVDSTIPEWAFLSELAQATGCGILLDVNNVHVSAHNLGLDPREAIERIHADAVVQIHLAGPRPRGDLLVDTHDQAVPAEVWPLYRRALERMPGVPTLLEWDSSIPSWEGLVAELERARVVRAACGAKT